MAVNYIPAKDVTSPVKRWALIKVLDDPGAGECTLALGLWDNSPVLAMRWNGSADNRLGNPQSRGLPTWFIVPHRYYPALVQTLPADLQKLAKNLLPMDGK